MTKREPSIDAYATDIEYIKNNMKEIKERLERKYVSHETFDLSIRAINDALKNAKILNGKTQILE